jgi:hypothetical protein
LKVFAVIDEEDLINEGVVVKKSRGGMKIIREDGTESVIPSITKVLVVNEMKNIVSFEKFILEN